MKESRLNGLMPLKFVGEVLLAIKIGIFGLGSALDSESGLNSISLLLTAQFYANLYLRFPDNCIYSQLNVLYGKPVVCAH